MKPIKWTEEKLRKICSEYDSASSFKKDHSGGYKRLIKLKLSEELFPISSRERHPLFTFEMLKELSLKHPQRSKLQKAEPSAYNAAQRNKWLDQLFPPPLNKKYSHEELKSEAAKYRYRSEFERGSPKKYQVAQKRGVLDEICAPKIQGFSIAEKELLEFLLTLKSDFISKRFKNDYELDCYSEELKLGVEYNGLFWHSEAAKKDAKNYHLNKTEYFKELGIRIIHIWEHEWRDRNAQVRNFLSSACRANAAKVGARKCKFEVISNSLAKSFLDENHIQGFMGATKTSIGAFYKEELIGVACFGKHHRQNGLGHSVLNRMAFKPGITIQGGVQKFTKVAFELLGPLQSWADRDKSEANGYLKAGWKLKSIGRPDYFYIVPGSPAKIISKQSRRKSVVGTPQEMTEREHSIQDGLVRVWNCGKILLIYS